MQNPLSKDQLRQRRIREALNMPPINSIKEMARDGQSVAGIARELAIDEKTVRKYLKQEDFSPQSLPCLRQERTEVVMGFIDHRHELVHQRFYDDGVGYRALQLELRKGKERDDEVGSVQIVQNNVFMDGRRIDEEKIVGERGSIEHPLIGL
jgi:hypothetical protein